MMNGTPESEGRGWRPEDGAGKPSPQWRLRNCASTLSATSPVSANESAARAAGPWTPPYRRRAGAFTLLEVMIACGIFFLASFTILGLVSSTLKNARSLQRIEVDAGMAAAQVVQLFKTNRQPELSISGDFGNSYPEYSWDAQSQEFDTNGLLRVDIVVNRRGLHRPVDTLSILVFSPDAKNTFGRPTMRP